METSLRDSTPEILLYSSMGCMVRPDITSVVSLNQKGQEKMKQPEVYVGTEDSNANKTKNQENR